jgi:phosphoribosylamine--glycine ligase
MKVLVVGSGGREDALAWKLSGCERADRVFIAPGNPGTLRHGENVDIQADDIRGLRSFALSEAIGLTVVGPEAPLSLGIVDAFREAGLKVFGPSRSAAELESSKSFSKALMEKYSIPTARHGSFEDARSALSFAVDEKGPVVVKADGLAAGKGVIVCPTGYEAAKAIDLMMNKRAFGEAGRKVVVEEFLEGEEASYIAVTDGRTIVPMAAAQDHKAAYDGDMGPNTGGMGAYSPAPVITPEIEARILDEVMKPAVMAMEEEGRPYTGVLYAGLMISGGAVKVLEFNCRFGDPETQPMLMRLEDDLLEVLMCAVEGGLKGVNPAWSAGHSVCVVMASKGYPGDYDRGVEIRGVEDISGAEDLMVFHAGTAVRGGRLVTSGGRVLGITALGKGIAEARDRAYAAVERVRFDGAHYRKDIGKKALGRG